MKTSPVDARNATTRNRICSPLWLCLLLAGMVTAQAESPNLLTNGDFATDLSGWEAPFGNVTWSMLDEFGDPNSGSLMLTDVGEFGTPFTQCLSPGPPGVTEFSLSYRVPDDVITVFDDGIILFVTWYAGADCAGGAVESVSIESGSIVRGQWIRMAAALPRPPGVNSVRVWPLMIGSGGSDFTSHIDNVYAGDRLFSDGFEPPSSP